VPNVNQITALKVIPKHRRLIIGSFKVYEYTKPFTPELSDDNPILAARFSSKRLEFYIAGEKGITTRKLIAGDHSGKVKVFDLFSETATTKIRRSSPALGTGSSRSSDASGSVLRQKMNCHRKWDYDRMKLVDEITAHRAEVVIVKFLVPFPLKPSAVSFSGATCSLLKKCALSLLSIATTMRRRASLSCSLETKTEPSGCKTSQGSSQTQGRRRHKELCLSRMLRRNSPPKVMPNQKRGGEEGNVEAMLGEEVFDQIAVISCHKDIIKSVQYIEVTDQPLIFTAGMDKLAKIWNLQGEL